MKTLQKFTVAGFLSVAAFLYPRLAYATSFTIDHYLCTEVGGWVGAHAGYDTFEPFGCDIASEVCVEACSRCWGGSIPGTSLGCWDGLTYETDCICT